MRMVKKVMMMKMTVLMRSHRPRALRFPPTGSHAPQLQFFDHFFFFFFWYVTCNGSAWLPVRGEAQGSEKVVGEHRAQR
jgi:hypothetical protein